MIKLLDRYFAWQVLQGFLGVTVVLLLIFVSNRLVRYLASAAAGELPGDAIITLIGLKAITYLILLLPLGLYLAVLLALGRMYRDSEMAALAACGVGLGRLYVPVMGIGVPLALAVGWLSLYGVPWTAQAEQRVLERAEQNLEVTGVRAGRFREGNGGSYVIYAEDIAEDQESMSNVFIRVQLETRQALLSAERAELYEAADGERYLMLRDGYRYEGVPGAEAVRMIRFERHGMRLERPASRSRAIKRSARPTSELWASESAGDAAELQWRLAVPLSVLVLGTLALPVGRSRPRQGRYGRLFVAILLYIGYVNLLAVAQEWTENGVIPPVLGLWWVHGLMLAIAATLLVRYLGTGWPTGRLGGEAGTAQQERRQP
ncbi:MAG: LPS export ABC transporter permease LptF [Gammaproteobacteria bacterium]|nr:LPS export ABC transporter permease LptF [Gammaproteobacteria bacterium]NIR97611.1 LPS export ABC transporter permease LptF [Gammaproteobacteria bacterium]NIT63261.1 LPS export ABC transporter permease LptF [Gammaproteobacteria bacterium]NIV20193.1 LPS export ABC transporter permease LptF [Gammaproteobacteria bacterium]NIY31841.1 LPS export ABC transporter permease LptF [Gammaproteobacteria bacterium]